MTPDVDKINEKNDEPLYSYSKAFLDGQGYIPLRSPDPVRDKNYSALQDTIMSNIAEQLSRYCSNEVFSQIYGRSLFPERLAAMAARACEEYIERKQNDERPPPML